VPVDPNGGGWDVFRRDILTGKTELVSFEVGGLLDGREPAASRDGETVVFVTRLSVTPLASSVIDTNQAADVVLRHMDRGSVEVVSVRGDGKATGNGASGRAEVAAGGRWVVFESDADDLVSSPDANRVTDVFLRDLDGGTTLRLSTRAVAGGAAGNGRSIEPHIGGSDTDVVVFQSSATDLVPRRGANPTDLFLWTRATGALRQLDLPGNPVVAGSEVVRVSNVVLSEDGKFVAFRAQTSGAPTAIDGVWLFDRTADTMTRIAETPDGTGVNGAGDATGPVMSSDGNVIAFEVKLGTASSPQRKVRIWRAETGTRSLNDESAADAASPAEPETSAMPVLDSGGTRLAFMTSGAVPGTSVTTDGASRLYVRELASGRTSVVPTGDRVAASELPCPEFEPGGGRLLFLSALPVADGVADSNQAFDVFVTRSDSPIPEAVSVAGVPDPGLSFLGGTMLAARTPQSSDGRYVLVSASAEGDAGPIRHVYRVDRQTRTQVLVTRDSSGQPGSSHSTPLALSAEGRYALFLSAATNLIAGDTNAVEDLFRADLSSGEIIPVSVQDGGQILSSRAPVGLASASADGRWVAFLSPALDLVAALSGSGNNLFLRDISSRQTVCLSRDEPAAGITSVQGRARRFVVGEAGRLVAFLAGGSSASGTVYLYDRNDGSRRRMAVGVAHAFAVSDTPGVVAVAGTSTDGAGVGIHLWTAGQEALTEIVRVAAGSTIRSLNFSADGRVLVFVTAAALPEALTGVNDDNAVRDVFRYDLATGKVQVCSRDEAGWLSTLHSDMADVSADGNRLVFRQTPASRSPSAGSLVGVAGTRLRMFDATTGKAAGVGSSQSSGYETLPSLSRDGGTVVWVSSASAGDHGDGNGLADAFVMRVSAPNPGDVDSDGDGLPDAWESEFLGSLDQTGAEDADSDGAPNASEYQAGTHPGQAGSVFRVEAVAAVTGKVTLRWRTSVGISYRVESTESLGTGPWAVVFEELRGDGNVTSVELPSASEVGFVRVRARRL